MLFLPRLIYDIQIHNDAGNSDDNNESGVSPVSKRYMRAGIGNGRLLFSGLFVRISTLTYCIPYILHVHDRKAVCFSNISAYFARNAESLITQESSRKSCSPAGGFVPTRSHRGPRALSVFGRDRVLGFVFFERRNDKHQINRSAYRP